jgi:hypothetical protein
MPVDTQGGPIRWNLDKAELKGTVSSRVLPMWGVLCEAYRQECCKTRGGSLLNHAKRLPVNAYLLPYPSLLLATCEADRI